MMKERINSDPKRKRILVTEDGGLPVTVSVRKTDPFWRHECRFKDSECIVETERDYERKQK